MADAFIVKNRASTFAVISVTYPEGSECVCSKGNRTLTAKDRSGLFIFHIREAGSWTVHCQTGTGSNRKSAEKTVEIVRMGQAESVRLLYEKVYFLNGDENSTLTGGWTNSGGALTKDGSSLSLYLNGDSSLYGYFAAVHTANKVRIEYPTIDFTISEFGGGSFGQSFAGVVTGEISSNPEMNASTSLSSAVSGDVVSVDTSALIGQEAYIVVRVSFIGEYQRYRRVGIRSVIGKPEEEETD